MKRLIPLPAGFFPLPAAFRCYADLKISPKILIIRDFF